MVVRSTYENGIGILYIVMSKNEQSDRSFSCDVRLVTHAHDFSRLDGSATLPRVLTKGGEGEKSCASLVLRSSVNWSPLSDNRIALRRRRRLLRPRISSSRACSSHAVHFITKLTNTHPSPQRSLFIYMLDSFQWDTISSVRQFPSGKVTITSPSTIPLPIAGTISLL